LFSVRIHFLDNSSKVFLSERNTTVKDLLLQCLQKCGVAEPTFILPYFGLFESKNGGNIDGALDMEALISDTLRGWEDAGISQTAKFLFMIRLYMPSLWGLQHKDVVAFRLNKPKSVMTLETYFDEAEVVDVNCLHLQFIQAVYHVITGRYPTTPEQALDLGAVHFIFKFGEFKPDTHRVGFLGGRIVEFVPIKHLRSGAALTEWEANLLTRVQGYANAAARGDDDDEENGNGNGHGSDDHSKVAYFRRGEKVVSPQRKYMELVYAMEGVYGCSFFRCTQHCSRALPDTVQLGVHHHGLSLFDKTKKLVRMFHIEDIYRWGFKPNQMFYFEIAEENDLGTGSLEFDTVEGKVVSDLLTDYAMAFLKEREREDERHEQMKAGTFDVSTTHSRVAKAAAPSAPAHSHTTAKPPPPSPGPPKPPAPPGAPQPPNSRAPQRPPSVKVGDIRLCARVNHSLFFVICCAGQEAGAVSAGRRRSEDPGDGARRAAAHRLGPGGRGHPDAVHLQGLPGPRAAQQHDRAAHQGGRDRVSEGWGRGEEAVHT
jgi:hypothetical protein